MDNWRRGRGRDDVLTLVSVEIELQRCWASEIHDIDYLDELAEASSRNIDAVRWRMESDGSACRYLRS